MSTSYNVTIEVHTVQSWTIDEQTALFPMSINNSNYRINFVVFDESIALQLTCQHRRRMQQVVDLYDLFIYQEDDLDIQHHHVDKFHQLSDHIERVGLLEGEIVMDMDRDWFFPLVGFLRFEKLTKRELRCVDVTLRTFFTLVVSLSFPFSAFRWYPTTPPSHTPTLTNKLTYTQWHNCRCISICSSVSENSSSLSSSHSDINSGSSDSSSSGADNEDVVVTTDGDAMMTNTGDNADPTIQDNLTGYLTESVGGAEDLTGHLTESVGGAEDLTGRYAIDFPGQFPLQLRCVAGRYHSTHSLHLLYHPISSYPPLVILSICPICKIRYILDPLSHSFFNPFSHTLMQSPQHHLSSHHIFTFCVVLFHRSTIHRTLLIYPSIPILTSYLFLLLMYRATIPCRRK